MYGRYLDLVGLDPCQSQSRPHIFPGFIRPLPRSPLPHSLHDGPCAQDRLSSIEVDEGFQYRYSLWLAVLYMFFTRF